MTIALFVEPFFPLGDWRWLAIGLVCLTLFAILVYLEHRFQRPKKKSTEREVEDLKARLELERFERVTSTWPGRRKLNRLLGIDDD